jgi:uncharacterized membrane protein
MSNEPTSDPNLEKIKELLTSHEARLAGIERRLGLTLATTGAKPSVSVSSPTIAPTISSVSPSQSMPLGTTRRIEPVEQPKSGHWLGAIAVICFVLAAGFIIKLSIDSGWLTHERQLGLATLFGFSLIGAGFWLLKSDREYASLLPASGIIVLYLTAFGAHRFYSLLSFDSALVATSGISALCIWIYREIRHDLYPLTAAVGAYLAPIILDMNSANLFSAYYFLICSFAFATVSVWVQSRTLAIVASYLAISTTAALGLSLGQNELISALLALHLFVFAFGAVLHTKYSGVELTDLAAGAYFPVLILFYATEYYFISKINPELAPWCSLGFAAFLIALYVTAKRWSPEKNLASQTVVLGFTTLVCFHSGYLELLPKDAHPWLMGLIFLAAAFAPARFASPPNESNRAFTLPRLALFAVVGIEYVSLLYHLRPQTSVVPGAPENTSSVAVALFTLAAIWIYIARLTLKATVVQIDARIALVAAHGIAIFGFYKVASPQGSLAVSAAWLVYALAVMAFAFRLKDEVMAKSALMVLGLAAAKALLYDASSAPTLIRIFCLLLTGIVLYAAGLLMRRISAWKSNT